VVQWDVIAGGAATGPAARLPPASNAKDFLAHFPAAEGKTYKLNAHPA
jgi:hypothetical protein